MDLKGKKVAVIGAGVEGLSSVKFLQVRGADITLLDKKSKSELDAETQKKIKEMGVKTKYGPDYLSDLTFFDLIFRSPGVNPYLPQLIQAQKHDITLTSQTRFFFELCRAPIIGVTGTKGKGTTASLIFEILKAGGKKVFLGGNIGKPPLDFIDSVTAESSVVLELSSFQLVDLDKSPHIAVVLMVTSEHLDWHRNVDDYIKAKEPLVKFQSEKDYVVINKDFSSSKTMGESSKAKKYYFSAKDSVERGAYVEGGFVVSVTNGWSTIIKTAEIKLPGEHNLQNICAAVTVAGILEIPPATVSKALANFKGLEHRLEFVKEVNGVAYYNDSASTTPETAIAAMESFKNPKIMILGGSTKHSDFSDLAKAVAKKNVKAIILIGEEAGRIRKSIGEAGEYSGEVAEGLKSMEQVVKKANNIAKGGDIVILSPACASFDMFKSYLDRGIQFREAVKSL